MPLPQDKDRREDLQLALEELKDHKGYLAVQERLRTLLSNSRTELESAIPPHRFRQLQGEVQGLIKAIRVLDDIEKELKRET